jgi:hypothetical protein
LGRAEEIAYLRPQDRVLIQAAVQAMLKSGELLPQGKELMLAQDKDFSPPKPPKKVRLLSPFDPLVLQRKRLKRLFDFDYQLECYLPAAKRRYGYFCLPILYGDKFLGVADLKADREAGLLRVKAQHWQKNPNSTISASFRKALSGFARFHGLVTEE